MKKTKILFLPLLLTAIGIATHIAWFNPFNTFTFADWHYWPTQASQQLWYSWGTWLNFSQFGTPNIQIPFLVFNFFWSAITLAGLSWSFAVQVTFFWPIAILGFISPYILFRKISESDSAAFIAAVFYGSTTYFLIRQTAHLPVAFIYAITPLVFYTFQNALAKNTWKNWITFVLIYTISIGYEIRITFIVTFLLAIYFCFFYIKKWREYIAQIFLVGSILLIINTYWLLPTIFGRLTSSISDIADRGLFGNQLFDLMHALALHDSSWTGNFPNQDFIEQQVPYYFLIIPVLAFSTLVLKKTMGRHKRQLILYFSVITLFGILLTKQSGNPLPTSYLWIYEHIPGFNLFREASKFYLLSAFGFTGLLSILLKGSIKETSKRYTLILPIIILAIACLNFKPLLNGDINTLFINRNMPEDYVVLNKFINQQKAFFRTLWSPKDSRWGTFDVNHPKASNVAISSGEWQKFTGLSLTKNNVPIQSQITTIFDNQYANSLLDASSIKYVIVPLKDESNDDNFFRFYNADKQYYINELNNVPYLKKIDIGIKDSVIYENENYAPYFSVSTNLYSLQSLLNLNDKYALVTDQLKNKFHFTLLGDRNKLRTSLLNPFEQITNDTIHQNQIKSKLNKSKQSTLLVNLARQDLYARATDENFTIMADNSADIQLLGQSILSPRNPVTLYERKLLPNINYLFTTGTGLSPINRQSIQQFIGMLRPNTSIKIFAQDTINAIPNPKFELGSWTQQVGDCNAYDKNGILNLEVIQNSTDQEQSNNALQLEATTHVACTNTSTKQLQAKTEYILGFDYQSPNGQQAGYYLQFNDVAKTVVTERLPITSSDWQHFSKQITTPEGASGASLTIYSFSQDAQTSIITRYDNFLLNQLTLVDQASLPYQPLWEQYNLDIKDSSVLTFSDLNYTYANLVKNGSFEDGLWQQSVGDCNAYDDHRDIGMTIFETSASDGRQAIQLEATRHVACTGAALTAIKGDRDYNFSFDYQSPNAKEAGYYLQFNDPDNTTISQRISVNNTKWQSFNKVVRAPRGATSASIAVYAYESDRKTKIINRYDNFKLMELPDLSDRYYLVSNPAQNLTEPKNINFNLDNPTYKSITVTGASTPFYLNMSESFHPQWQIQLSNSKNNGWWNGWVPFIKPDRVSDENHYKLDDFLNGWYVDPAELCMSNNPACTKNADGSYNMKLVAEFFPQRWFYLGLLISGTTLLACFGYLGFIGVRKFRNRNNPPVISFDVDSGAAQQAAAVGSNVTNHQVMDVAMEMIEGGYSRKNATMVRLAQFTQDRWSVKGALSKFKNMKKADEE